MISRIVVLSVACSFCLVVAGPQHQQLGSPLEISSVSVKGIVKSTRCKRSKFCAGDEFDCCDPWSCCPETRVCCWGENEFRCCMPLDSTQSTPAITALPIRVIQQRYRLLHKPKIE